MKWILIILLIFLIMFIAKSLSEQYKDKYDFYLNLKNFLTQFKINVSFKQEKLTKFLSNIEPKKTFKSFIDAYKNYLNTNNLDLSEVKALEEDEKAELKDIIVSLGKFNTETELKQMEGFISSIDNKLEIALNNKNKLCPMIIKLSLLFAIGLAILLI